MSIAGIHEEVFSYLLGLHEKDNNFMFVPRQRDNKSRLSKKGYWFRGSNYINITFWEGSDNIETLHNIGFTITESGKSKIELSSRDNIAKAEFLDRLQVKLGGFNIIREDGKWVKELPGNDYMKNLKSFIKNEKKIIDAAIAGEKPEGIAFISPEQFKEYIDNIAVYRKSAGQNEEKIARICWNANGWKYPSGAEGKSRSKKSYEFKSGFGYEEWLFDRSRTLGGYHYAFLQPLFVRKGRHIGKKYNISLVTRKGNAYYFAGRIKNAGCITREEAEEVYQKYKAEGWLDEMKRDVTAAEGKLNAFEKMEARNFFNVKFKFSDVEDENCLSEIAADDVNIRIYRYRLQTMKEAFRFCESDDYAGGYASVRRNTNAVTRHPGEVTVCDPVHNKMQNFIFDLLNGGEYKKQYEFAAIENKRVDIKAKVAGKANLWHYFEIKTDNARESIRQALGQLLEYAYFPERKNKENVEKLIIVSNREPDENIKEYLEYIRKKFNIPVSYRFYNFETKELSQDY